MPISKRIMQTDLSIFVQARMSSSRLPGKVLKWVQDKPILFHQLERIKQSKWPCNLVVITSDQPEDDVLTEICELEGYTVFRGSLTDLLDRHYQAAKHFNAKHIVKIPSDCPLIDPVAIDRVLGFYMKNQSKFDFVSNLHPQSYPDGNDVEVMSFDALERAWRETDKPFEREHTTPYFWENPDRFRIGNVLWETGLNYEMSHRFTLDYPEDLTFIETVYNRLYPLNPHFNLRDILDLLTFEPAILEINRSLAGVNWYRNHLAELKTITPDQTKQV